jgi:hypothetical protein
MRILIAVLLSVATLLPLVVQAGEQSCSGPLKRPVSEFVISADGLELKDLKTGLIWSRCLEGSAWDGQVCQSQHPVHAAVVPANDFSYGEALALASARSTDTTKPAWRIPSMKELSTIREPNCYNPSANLALFPVDPAWSSDGSIWSSSTAHEGQVLSKSDGKYGGRFLMSAVGVSDSHDSTTEGDRAYVRLVHTDPDFKMPQGLKPSKNK